MRKMGGGGGGKGREGGRVQERLSYGGDTWFHLTSLGENRVKFKGSSRVGLPWGVVHGDTYMRESSAQSLKLWIVLLSLRRPTLHEQICLTDNWLWLWLWALVPDKLLTR